MKKILLDANLAEKMGKAAMKIAEYLAPDKIYGQWEKFINNVMSVKN